ncbi:unnamed protein product [Clonostachys rosea f. rosea IK726]|uniref:RanBD1 domain-containing protein n=2 Tax=Bionectria ochroleuca TaxID=29856 RepID=A0A0B7KC67_BIOOC|nr:unnamed protein product [Clonostachys rosea f. rosea IK726]
MVTFALPGDNDAGDAGSATPKSRPGLAFSQRGFAASPYGSVGKRAGSSTPLGGSIRKSFIARSEPPASSLGRSFAGQRNIFRASAISDSPPTANTFSPSVPQSTMKRVFAPGATPEPSRTARELGAQSATRGVAARAKDKDLFPMRISSPPPELTGEALAQKVPKDWDPKGSIYADQFLAHLAPAEFDEDQRRQFFCILDLRRLKYAADEIFVKKGWKLNVMNFAKEFEKSRSIILLRYGLYEFQNVKPSKEILKRWRREHGLPDPEEEEAEPTPTKTTSKKKRKATDDGEGLSTPALKSKKRDLETDTPVAPFAAATAPSTTPAAAPPAASKNKRKASLGEETQAPPAKVQKPTSGARSMFEQAANKASSTPSTTPAKPSFSSAKPATNNLMRSVLKSEAAQAASSTNGNIFGYLSDNSSAKNSGVDADAESESDSEESPEAEQADERSAKRPALTSTVDTPSDAGTRESTPGRSLFDRITTDEGGQPVRATTPLEPAPAALKDQTWKPDAAPLKFAAPTSTPQTESLSAAPPSAAPSVIGSTSFNFTTSKATSSSSEASPLFATKPSSAFASKPSTAVQAPGLFANKPSSTSSLFGAPKPDAAAEKPKEAFTETAKKDAESDKENVPNSDQAPAGTKPATPQPSLGFQFGPKPAAAEPSKETPAAAPSLFGPSSASTTSNLFGAPKAQTASTSAVLGSTTLFGKPTETNKEPEKPAASEPPKPATPFSGFSTPSTVGNKPASNPFGAGSSSSPGLFKNNASTAPATSSGFPFGAPQNGGAQANSTPLFAPKSPPTSFNNSMVEGSPMKQDDKSPAKPIFSSLGNTTTPAAAPIFSWNAPSSGTAPASTPAPSSNMFGPASNPPAGSGNTGGMNFNFAASSGTINNPFSSGAAVTATSSFEFGKPASGSGSGSSPFQFNANNASPAPIFGINQGNTNGSAPSSGGTFTFSGNNAQPQQGAGTPFGNNQNIFNLQPPTGGPSTGTNTPFSLGDGSSLATTPARGTPEPTGKAETAKEPAKEPTKAANDEEGEKHEQINLTDGAEEGEDTLHEVRAKVLKFIPAGSEGDDKPKSKSPWSTQGVGPLRVLQNKETKLVRLLLRAEPRGHVALNRALMPEMSYKADNKYVKITTSNEKGDGLETWMIQVKTKELAIELAEALEKHKKENKK